MFPNIYVLGGKIVSTTGGETYEIPRDGATERWILLKAIEVIEGEKNRDSRN